MKALMWIGLALLILGVALLFVPIPHNENHAIKAGDVSLGVQTRSEQKVTPLACVVMIAAGAGLIFAGRKA
jgi:uncharacterized membrane protein